MSFIPHSNRWCNWRVFGKIRQNYTFNMQIYGKFQNTHINPYIWQIRIRQFDSAKIRERELFANLLTDYHCALTPPPTQTLTVSPRPNPTQYAQPQPPTTDGHHSGGWTRPVNVSVVVVCTVATSFSSRSPLSLPSIYYSDESTTTLLAGPAALPRRCHLRQPPPPTSSADHLIGAWGSGFEVRGLRDRERVEGGGQQFFSFFFS